MNHDSAQVTTLIKELLVLNRAENNPGSELPVAKDAAARKSKRKRIRQELVQALNFRDEAKK